MRVILVGPKERAYDLERELNKRIDEEAEKEEIEVVDIEIRVLQNPTNSYRWYLGIVKYTKEKETKTKKI